MIETLAGVVRAVLPVLSTTDRFPADLVTETVQVAVEPTRILVGVQVRDDRIGVDQSVTIWLLEDEPIVAVTIA